MILVGGIGFSCALISIFNNLVLFYVFVTESKNSLASVGYFTYLTGLSVCDVIISFFYITIMSAQVRDFQTKQFLINIIKVYAEYFEMEWLFRLWHYFLPISFTISNITFTIAAFLLVFATLERYIQTIKTPMFEFK